MRVMVIGSYRPQEGQRRTARDAGDRFEAMAFALGKGLAENGHDLVLGWSYNNLISQLGVKTQNGVRVTRHPKSHPYWETADFHALRGFASVLRQYPAASSSKRIFIETAGRSDELPQAGPFTPPAVLGSLPQAPLKGYRAQVGEELAGDIKPGNELELGSAALAPFVDIHHSGDFNASTVRQELLARLFPGVQAVLCLGGGKATAAAIERCDRAKLLIPAPFSPEGAFSEEEEQRRSMQSAKLQTLWGELARMSGRTGVAMSHDAARRLPALVSAARDTGAPIPYSDPAFVTSLALVALILAGLCAVVGMAARAKGASALATLGFETFAVVFFAMLVWTGFEFILKAQRPKPLKLFFGVLGAGILATGPTLGLMTDGLGLISPENTVAEAPLEPPSNSEAAVSARKPTGQ